MALAEVTDYPWHALDTVPREGVRRLALLRSDLASAVDLDDLSRTMGQLLSGEVDLVLLEIRLRPDPSSLPSVRVALEIPGLSAQLVVGVEPAFASVCLSRVLGRLIHLPPAAAELSESLEGAWAAVVVETARRAGSERAITLRATAGDRASGDGLLVRGTVILDGKPYATGVWALSTERPSASVSDPRPLAAAGDLPVRVPLVIGQSVASRAELSELVPGDGWSCGDGWFVDSHGQGRAALAAPGRERGVAVDLTPDGDLVVRGESIELPWDTEVNETTNGNNETLADAVLETPVVVRVELGSVSMTAREWAALGTGDVILAGRRLTDPAILRVGGREVAHGELVNVEGELGVRVVRILAGESES